MAIQTIIDEQFGAILQRGDIMRINRRTLQTHAFVGLQRRRYQQGGQRYAAHKTFNRWTYHVTLPGSGLHLSIFEYQGISRKNRK